MKVAHVTAYIEDDPNGVAVQSFEFAREMAKLHKTVLIGPGPKTEFREAQAGKLDRFTLQSVNIFQLNVHKLSLSTIRTVVEFLDEYKPDVIHSHTPVDLGLITLLWALQNNIPFFHTIHSLPTKAAEWLRIEALGTAHEPFLNYFIKNYMLPFVSNSTAVVSLNESVTEDLKELGYEGDVISIPNGFNLTEYEKCTPTDITSKKKVITYVGSLEQRKNQIFLATVMKHLPPNYELNLIGGLLDKVYVKKISKFAEKEHLKNINITGKISHDKIPDLLQKTHVFVSASFAEVQSLVIIEALASCTPVVGFTNQTVDQFVDDQVGTVVPQNISPKGFAAEIEKICNMDEKKYSQMAIQARKKVEHLDWKHVLKRIENMYQAYINKQKQSQTEEEKNKKTGKVLALIPNRKFRESISKLLKKKDKRSQISIKSVKSKPKLTFAFLGLTMVLSLVIYTFIKLTRLFGGKNEKIKKNQE